MDCNRRLTDSKRRQVDSIVIELHGDKAESIFHEAIAPYGFAISRCDELTVCLSTESRVRVANVL